MNDLAAHKKLLLRIAVIVVAAVLIWVQTAVDIPTSRAGALQITATPTTVVATPQPGAPVEVGGEVLFFVRQRVGSLSPSARAALISGRINDLATNPFAPPLELTLAESAEGTDILAGEEVLMTLTDRDAAALGMERSEAAQDAARRIKEAVERTRLLHTPRARLIRLLEVVAILAIVVLAFYLSNKLFRRAAEKVDAMSTEDERLKFLSNTRAYRSGGWKASAKRLLGLLRLLIYLVLLIIVMPLVLGLFPTTASLAGKFLNLLLRPLEKLWRWIVDYEQELFTILVILALTYGLIRLVRWFFSEIEQGGVRLGGFEPEWASFTGKMVSFLLVIGAVIVAFPYLPGSDSDAFRGITIFLGALFTLSSTAAVTNIVAGVIQTYTGAFRVGDVVLIGQTTGIVMEKRLLTTRVRTFKNEEVSIPNGTVLNTNVVNYSTMAQDQGVVIYTTITIGYDAPWQRVHELLIASALATPDILPEPGPFVLQTSLNDYHISYQLNCYTRTPERMPRLYSGLHQNIQDQFNGAGVEIMSPAFMGLRDANTVTIPEPHRPAGYEPFSFRVQRMGGPRKEED